MFGCECLCWNRDSQYRPLEPQPFSLPAPIPEWPRGQGFATGQINLGDIVVIQITQFERVWSCNQLRGKSKGVTFYKPVGFPNGFFSLGHYCQPNDQALRGYVLVAQDAAACRLKAGSVHDSPLGDPPALIEPLGYTLMWNTDSHYDGCGYFWLPNAPAGYKAMGFVVTDNPNQPALDDVRCVREDLTDTCETFNMMLNTGSNFSKPPFIVWNTRPCKRGMLGTSVSVGTFFCSTRQNPDEELNIACLKNLDPTLHAMPNLKQIHALIQHYGAKVFFHPDDIYMPSSVPWFFKNGALVYQNGKLEGKPIDSRGSNLPCGGENDGQFWIDLPDDEDEKAYLKSGNLESAELYVHVKPALGGTFTDIAMWIFCPFNGPATIKVGIMSIPMSRIGEHVGDWEHFTLRLSNFTGELWSVYFSQHSAGTWVDAPNLEFIEGNKPVVYASKGGHASFAHPGTYVQGPSKLGIGVRNDTARSKFFIDSSTKYQIVAAEYLGDTAIVEPNWLQYMREWGPTIVYDSRAELEKIISLLPVFFRFSVENIFDLFPTELYGEEGPTGPKEKDNWLEDERC